jgi:CxxC-x17-CxxC domain-containing protein
MSIMPKFNRRKDGRKGFDKFRRPRRESGELDRGDSGGFERRESGGSSRRESGGFKKREYSGFNKRESGGFRDRDSGGFNRRDSGGFKRYPGGPEMHKAVCVKCGEDCEVPFKPNPKKPVFCSKCYEKHEGTSRPNKPASMSSELEQINQKLDRILKALHLD